MKNLILVVAILGFCIPATAQEQTDHVDMHHKHHHNYHEREHRGIPPFSYIGFSSGINNPAGAIGFDFDVPVHQYLSIGAGGGFSTWGNKLQFDAKYFLRKHHRGWALGGGFTFNSGDNNYTTRFMPTVAGVKEQVNLDLRVQRNVFFAIYHYWNLGRRYNRFFTGLGWSVPLVDRKFIQLNGDQLTQQSANRVDKLAPGGLMISIGFSFGLHH